MTPRERLSMDALVGQITADRCSRGKTLVPCAQRREARMIREPDIPMPCSPTRLECFTFAS